MRTSGVIFDPLVGLSQTFNPGDGVHTRNNTMGSRMPVQPRPLPGENALGIIYLGQSTAASFGTGALYTSSHAKSLMGNIFDGLMYACSDVMPGTDSITSTTGSSPGAAIPDQLIVTLGKYHRVAIVNVAMGSTRSVQWTSEANNLLMCVRAAYVLLQQHGYRTIKLCFQQGEGDAADGTSAATQATNITMLRYCLDVNGVNVPLYVSKTTFGYGGWVCTDPNPALWAPPPGSNAANVRLGQANAVNGSTILAGPDTDLIRGFSGGRGTGAHWGSQAEIIACAAGWAAVL